MGAHDKAEIARLRAADPERARITDLVRRSRTAPLTPEESAEVDAWRVAEIERKARKGSAA